MLFFLNGNLTKRKWERKNKKDKMEGRKEGRKKKKKKKKKSKKQGKRNRFKGSRTGCFDTHTYTRSVGVNG